MNGKSEDDKERKESRHNEKKNNSDMKRLRKGRRMRWELRERNGKKVSRKRESYWKGEWKGKR